MGPAAVGTTADGFALLGAFKVGILDGLPGDTVGPNAAGASKPDAAYVGLPLGDPGVPVDPAVVGT